MEMDLHFRRRSFENHLLEALFEHLATAAISQPSVVSIYDLIDSCLLTHVLPWVPVLRHVSGPGQVAHDGMTLRKVQQHLTCAWIDFLDSGHFHLRVDRGVLISHMLHLENPDFLCFERNVVESAEADHGPCWLADPVDVDYQSPVLLHFN